MDKQRLSAEPNFRQLRVNEFDELVELQPGRNRNYIQLQPGKLNATLAQAWLGDVQLLHENIDVGARIEANPPPDILPFSYVKAQGKKVSYCQQPVSFESSLTQATGGNWDIVFAESLEYYGAAFDKSFFVEGFQTLTQHELPNDVLTNQARLTSPLVAVNYGAMIERYFLHIKERPELLLDPSILKLMASSLLSQVVESIVFFEDEKQSLPKLKKRQVGVNKVIEYLHCHACDLPDIQTLCRVANLSERSLQYGFTEAMGLSPIQYLRLVRLNGAKRSLEQAQAKLTKVVDVATEWGFVELGRFARDYKALFQELPSHTLNNINP